MCNISRWNNDGKQFSVYGCHILILLNVFPSSKTAKISLWKSLLFSLRQHTQLSAYTLGKGIRWQILEVFEICSVPPERLSCRPGCCPTLSLHLGSQWGPLWEWKPLPSAPDPERSDCEEQTPNLQMRSVIPVPPESPAPSSGLTQHR